MKIFLYVCALSNISAAAFATSPIQHPPETPTIVNLLTDVESGKQSVRFGGETAELIFDRLSVKAVRVGDYMVKEGLKETCSENLIGGSYSCDLPIEIQ